MEQRYPNTYRTEESRDTIINQSGAGVTANELLHRVSPVRDNASAPYGLENIAGWLLLTPKSSGDPLDQNVATIGVS